MFQPRQRPLSCFLAWVPSDSCTLWSAGHVEGPRPESLLQGALAPCCPRQRDACLVCAAWPLGFLFWVGRHLGLAQTPHPDGASDQPQTSAAQRQGHVTHTEPPLPRLGPFRLSCSVWPWRSWECRRTRCKLQICPFGVMPAPHLLSHEHDFLSGQWDQILLRGVL